MKNLICIILVVVSFNLYGQKSISGQLIDHRTKELLISSDLHIYKVINDSIDFVKVVNTNDLGQFLIDSIASGVYQIQVTISSYSQVIINNIELKDNIELCNVYLYEVGIEWSGNYIDENNISQRTGGYENGYLEKNGENNNVTLNYFCNDTITCNYHENILRIDYKMNKK
jgi:hypothetical protein